MQNVMILRSWQSELDQRHDFKGSWHEISWELVRHYWYFAKRWVPSLRILTHWGLLIDVFVSWWNHHWFRLWLGARLVPSHYLIQCWLHVSWTFWRIIIGNIFIKIQISLLCIGNAVNQIEACSSGRDRRYQTDKPSKYAVLMCETLLHQTHLICATYMYALH